VPEATRKASWSRPPVAAGAQLPVYLASKDVVTPLFMRPLKGIVLRWRPVQPDLHEQGFAFSSTPERLNDLLDLLRFPAPRQEAVGPAAEELRRSLCNGSVKEERRLLGQGIELAIHQRSLP
jgi:hypothetical protein